MTPGRIVMWRTFSMDLPLNKYENPILLFPDSVHRHGVFGGYAPLMTARNAFGVPVKISPYSNENSYFTEQTAFDYRSYWEFPFKIAGLWLNDGNTVWMPAEGFLNNPEIATRTPIFANAITKRVNQLAKQASTVEIL